MNIHTTNTVSDWVFSKLKKKLNAKKCKTSLGARKPNWINNISKNVWGHLRLGSPTHEGEKIRFNNT
jgi:hypothetical protein